MKIQGLNTRQDKEAYLMNIFKLLVTELPQEGLSFEETDDYISLKTYEKAVLRDYSFNEVA